jgi:hypothetical protein
VTAIAACLASACARSTEPAAPARAVKPGPPLHDGPLTDFVPAAGLRWLLVGEPQKIAESPAFRSSVSLLLPPDHLQTFAKGSGVVLEQVPSGAIAGFDLGTLYLFVPPPSAASAIVARFRERIVGGERVDTPHPLVTRVSGVIGEHPQALVSIEERLVAIAVGDPTLARVVEAFARKKLHQSPPALRGAALSQLAAPAAEAVAAFYAPGPFEGDWARAARGLLADAVALSLTLIPTGPEQVRAQLELAGDFPASGADDLAAGFQDLAQSSTGKLLALDQISEPRVREREGRLILDVDLALAPIARGLRAAVIADVWEILDLPRRPTH